MVQVRTVVLVQRSQLVPLMPLQLEPMQLGLRQLQLVQALVLPQPELPH